MIPEPDIITCAEWGARQPKSPISPAGKPDKAIFHHTAGLAGGSSPKAYARSIQNFHMDSNGWNDSGHNFLICRDGTILEGRHGSIAAVRNGKMVVSAHCPGQNTNPGVEHEHVSGPMTTAQFNASVALHAWMCDRGGFAPTQILPHRQFVSTACPGELSGDLSNLRAAVAGRLKQPQEDELTLAEVDALKAAAKKFVDTGEGPGPLSDLKNRIFWGFVQAENRGKETASADVAALQAKIAAARTALA